MADMVFLFWQCVLMKIFTYAILHTNQPMEIRRDYEQKKNLPRMYVNV